MCFVACTRELECRKWIQDSCVLFFGFIFQLALNIFPFGFSMQFVCDDVGAVGKFPDQDVVFPQVDHMAFRAFHTGNGLGFEIVPWNTRITVDEPAVAVDAPGHAFF